MLEKVRRWAGRHQLFTPGSRVLAACSGGPDSLALVHVLDRLKGEYGFSLAVAYVNHMFRPEAAQEAEFVACYAAGLGLACHTTAIDVAAYGKANKLSPQEAGRLLRYQYLHQVSARWGGALIATGHHRDDQVETVLINLLRGAGSSGLKGMRPSSGGIIRPLLPASRSEIEAYCQQHGLTPCQDSSNFKRDYLRNRIRLDLLPALEAGYNPAIRKALWQLAQLAGDDYDYMCSEAGKLWGSVMYGDGCKVVISGQAFAALHPAVRRECIRQAIEKKRGYLTGISFDHVEKLVEMAVSGTVGSLMLLPGGLAARKTYTALELLMAAQCAAPEGGDILDMPSELVVPGQTTMKGITVTAEVVETATIRQEPFTALFDFDKISLPLTVRARRPGDRFRPLGLNGSKKLKDFFIDAKVPESKRSSVPIISDQQEIIWLAGYRQSDHGRISAATKKILRLTITKREEF